jgi:hypothetical protein
MATVKTNVMMYEIPNHMKAVFWLAEGELAISM